MNGGFFSRIHNVPRCGNNTAIKEERSGFQGTVASDGILAIDGHLA